MKNTTSLILTGGKNLRMGRNKAFEVLNGKTLLERVYEKLEPLSSEIIIVTSNDFLSVPTNNRMKVVADILPEKGPLGGILTGLSCSGNETNIVVGCDMPFLKTPLLSYMTELLDGFDAVVPTLGQGMKEPLHAVYSKACKEKIRQRLQEGKLSVHSFIDTLKVRYVDKEKIMQFDPELTSFFDINYPSDLIRASAIAEQYDNR